MKSYSQAFAKAVHALNNRRSHEYVNEAYQHFPEDEKDEAYKISDKDDDSSDDTESLDDDSAYQTISKDSNDSVPDHRHRRRSTKTIR